MKRRHALSLLVTAVFSVFATVITPVGAATGDIVSCTVRSDGWSVDLVIEGFTSGADYDFDFAANNTPTSTTPLLSVVSQGYDETLTPGTVTLGAIARDVNLTKEVRQAYPNEALTDETTGGGNLTVRIALSDYVYVDDNTGAGKSGTAPTVTLKSGFVVNTGGASQSSAAVTAAAVTNSSTAVYPKVVANWSRPPFDRVTGDFSLGVVAFHGVTPRSGSTQIGGGKHNIACVKYTVADTSSNSTTTIVTAPTVDSGYGDAVPVSEHIGTIDVSELTALNILTANFIAYPLVGDESSVMDSSAGTVQPTPLVGPVTFVNDKSNTYGVTCALVDDTGGSDAGSNTVYDASTFDPTTAYKFASINKAAQAIRSYNNTNHSRNDVSGGIIYLADGTYAWTGASNSTGTTNDAWCIVTRASNSTNRASVIIGSHSGNAFIGAKCLVRDVTISSAASIGFSTQPHLWLDQCTVTTSGTALVYSSTQKWITRCNFTAAVNGVFRPYSSQTSPTALIRGNTVSTLTESIYCYNVLGNSVAAGGFSLVDNISGQTIVQATNHICAFNRCSGTAQPMLQFLASTAATSNCAIVQNLFEGRTKNVQPLISIAGDGTTTTPINNLILWHNTMVGQRQNLGYNDTGSAAAAREHWSAKGNIAYDSNIKTDTFTGTAPNGGRIGNWPWLYQAGCNGNLWADYGNGFNFEFAGLSSEQTAWTSPDPESYFDFTTYAAYDGTGSDGTAGAGGGDYTLQRTSPAVGIARDWLLPVDLNGVSRGSPDAAGAYHFGTGNSNFFPFFQ